MPDRYVVLGTSLTAVADEIRAKGGTSAPLEWPDEYILAVRNISGSSAVNVVGTWKDGYSYLTPNAVTNMSTSGETATTGYSCGYMSCVPGDVFYLTGVGGSGAKLWVWTKENGDIISRANSSVSDTDLKLTAPVEAAYLLYNSETSPTHFIIKTANIGVGQWIDGYIYNTSTTITNISIHDLTQYANGYSCGYLPCAEGDKFRITGTGGSGAKLWAWTKANGDIISRANSSVVETDLEITAPTDAAYLIYNAETAKKHFVIGNITPHGGGGGTYQAKTNIDPSTSSQTITADSGYDALSSVQINAMPSGTAGTPTATKGTVSNHSISVTPSVTNTTGYITGSTINGTAVSVSASELVSGSETKTANGTYDVTNLASLIVNVSGGVSNVVTGTFKGTTTGAAMDVNLSYSGSGYPISVSVQPTGGYLNNSTFNSTVQRYAIASFIGMKLYPDATPTYTSSSANENLMITNQRYKSSSSNATSYGGSSGVTNASTYTTSNSSATSSSGCLRFKNKNTMNVYIASTSYGFMANVEYKYWILYSS